jgi:hypothetical protein
MLVGRVSAKGSPGVTAAALTFTATAGDSGLLVELDPSGESVECWTGATGEPGLIRVASGLRRSVDPEMLLAHAVEAPAGVRSGLAPTAGGLAESTIAATGDRLVPALAGLDRTVVVDGGRWSRSQVTARRLVGCEVVGVVCTPTVEGIEAARWLVEPLNSIVTDKVVVVLVGDRPYPPGEVAAAVGVPVVGALAWDPRGLSALLTTGAGRGWARSALARSTRSAFDRLTRMTKGSVMDRA